MGFRCRKLSTSLRRDVPRCTLLLETRSRGSWSMYSPDEFDANYGKLQSLCPQQDSSTVSSGNIRSWSLDQNHEKVVCITYRLNITWLREEHMITVGYTAFIVSGGDKRRINRPSLCLSLCWESPRKWPSKSIGWSFRFQVSVGPFMGILQPYKCTDAGGEIVGEYLGEETFIYMDICDPTLQKKMLHCFVDSNH